MQVRIYQPARNAMQSGKGNTRQWLLEFVSPAKREADPLAAYRRIRKPMPPPERIVPDKRRVLDQDEARREIEEER